MFVDIITISYTILIYSTPVVVHSILAFQSLSDYGYYWKLAIQVDISHYVGIVRKSAEHRRWGYNAT